MGRPSCQSSLLGDPNANFSVEMCRRSNIKEGRHVGLEFYDLLIEAHYRKKRWRGSPTYNRLRVDSRTTSSGATFLWVAATSRFSSTPLMPSTTMPTADAPMVSMGWRTVVRAGVHRVALATSSNPITEQCAGTRKPAFATAQHARKA